MDDGSHETPRTPASLLIIGGSLLTLVTALEPQPTGAWHLQAAWLMCGLIPYIVYGSLVTLLDGCTLLTTGILLLAADLAARTGFGLTAAAQLPLSIPVWLCLVMVLAVLPAGVLVGKMLGRVPACRRGGGTS